MSSVVNLLVIAAFGVIIADLVAHAAGTKALFGGVADIWTTSVNGMLGNTTTTAPGGAQTPKPAGP
jgi:hypothetical protein